MQESWKLNFVEFVAFSIVPDRTRLCLVLYKLAKIRFVLESQAGKLSSPSGVSLDLLLNHWIRHSFIRAIPRDSCLNFTSSGHGLFTRTPTDSSYALKASHRRGSFEQTFRYNSAERRKPRWDARAFAEFRRQS